MITESVVFVNDIDGELYYIPLKYLDQWNMWCHEEYGLDGCTGGLPDFATAVEGKTYIVNIVGEF